MARKDELRHISLRKKIRRRYGTENYAWRDGRLVDKATGFAVQSAPEVPKPQKKPPPAPKRPFRGIHS